MSFYDSDGAWAAPARQPSWEQQAAPPTPRSGSGSAAAIAAAAAAEPHAFATQFEEIDRATDNLMKSGKWFPGQAPAVSPGAGLPGVVPARRDSGPAAAPPRGYDGFGGVGGGGGGGSGGGGGGGDPRAGPPSRHPSVSEYDGGRPGSAGLQGYYAGQRFPGGRQSEAEQMLQAKRRMAAQRERELRNYHQEQQYNRTVSGGKSDRAMSPNTMSEEDRRELIARQHRALYGDNSSLYGAEGAGAAGSRPSSQDVRVSGAPRGPSPLAFDPFGVHAPPAGGADGAVQMPPRDRAGSTASPASNNPPAGQPPSSFALLNEAPSSATRTSTSSPGGSSPPLGQGPKGPSSGVAPIGTRPSQPSGSSVGGLNKRSTTPLTPSSLSHGFSTADAPAAAAKDERTTSAPSNPPLKETSVGGLGNWGSNSGVWGSGKGPLAVQPSVWG